MHDVVDFPDVRLEGRMAYANRTQEARWPEQGRDHGVVPVHVGCRVGEPLEGCLRVGTPLGCLRGCGTLGTGLPSSAVFHGTLCH